MSFQYKCGVVQLNSGPDLDQNLRAIRTGVLEAASLGAELVCLPECSPYLGPQRGLLENIASIEQKFEAFLSELSSSNSIAILAGGYRKADSPNKVFNCIFWSTPDSPARAIYDKLHLFDVSIPDGVDYSESSYIQRGQTQEHIIKTPAFGNITTSICYDLRFPEFYRTKTSLGANVIFIPAAFTKFTGQSHWEILVRARAIENLAWVIAPAQTGTHFGKRESWGHSMIVDPWGNVVSSAGNDVCVISAQISQKAVEDARNQIPSTHAENMFRLTPNP